MCKSIVSGKRAEGQRGRGAERGDWAEEKGCCVNE